SKSGRRCPYRQASPRRPGTASALGLRAGEMCRHSIADQPGKGERTMSLHSWLQGLRSALTPGRTQRDHRRRASRRAATHRPSLEVLETRSVPAFLAPIDYDAGASPSAVVTADFNSDGHLDLATANYNSNGVSILLGNGDGTFRTARILATDGSPVWVEAG